jgi:uncharacterized metal-binding protein YceD (DUF177 family)
MKILFDKIGHTIKPFKIEEDGVEFEGSIQKSGYHRVQLLGEIGGAVELTCNRCGVHFDTTMDTPLKLTISDQIVEDKVDLDIIEFLDGEIDISFILTSEINTLKSEYHYCSQCEGSDEPFEMEF